MNLLIIGGTIFVGRHLVAAALERGHSVTIFHRGKHNPDLFPSERFPKVETVLGDRTNEDDLEALAERGFDAVVDTCGYVPRVVSLSARKLARSVPFYCFISTVSVYADMATFGLTEDAELATLPDPTVEEVTGETYGGLKVLCERAVQEIYPDACLISRPGLIVGPYDVSDRFTYWPHRIARGGKVLCPGDPEAVTQFIDVRDLAEWTVRLVERKTTGVFNATGPDYPLTFGELFDTCKSVSGSDAEFVWASEEFLLEREVGPWIELPLWIPARENAAGQDRISIAKSLKAGLTIRPLSETVSDTLAWDMARPREDAWKKTLTPEKEAELLAVWEARAGA
jgi:2'-hydroxyisoflavone reductase